MQVHYVDHGFSEVISKTKVFELHEKFFQLPFQASKCKLAGDDRIRTASVPLAHTSVFLTWALCLRIQAWSRSARNPKC